MHPPTHALIGWAVANVAPDLDRRSRAMVFFASVIPDLDGLTFVGKLFGHEELYLRYHRTLCHNLPFALACAALAAALAPLTPTGPTRARRALVAGLVWLNFHLHLLCDYLGSAGPDGSIWGIPYLQPWSDWQLDNPHQWQLASWQNIAITLAFLAIAVQIARRFGRTPVEAFSLAADRPVVAAIQARFGAVRPAADQAIS